MKIHTLLGRGLVWALLAGCGAADETVEVAQRALNVHPELGVPGLPQDAGVNNAR
jgi:hypothetical protein